MKPLWLAASIWIGASLGAAPADVVTLTDGKRLEGRVVRDSAREVVVRKGSRDHSVDPNEIATVDSLARKLKEALARWDRTSVADPAALRELILECKLAGLDGEARVLALHGLALAPDDAEFHQIAGHEKRGEQWHVRSGARREAFAKRSQRKLDWGEAWELSTTHFALRCNLPLPDALACALELELFYRAFLDWFGDELPLYEPNAPMTAHVYAGKAEFPESSGRRAYFETSANVLHVNAHEGLDLGVLVHEATHQLLFNTSANTKAAVGAIPPWLDEGLAEYMAACREGAPGRATYVVGKPHHEHFERHRAAEKTYDLARVLSMGLGDFAASSNSPLKYSQAYTLTHFCLHGGPRGQRERFFDFFRRAYAGNSSMTAFKDAMAVKERELEAAWRAHVQAVR